MRGPVANHKHLHGRGRISGDGKERASGRSEIALLVASSEVDLATADGYGLVNRDRARGVAFDFEGLRRQVLGAAKSRGERNGRPAVGELENDLYRERGAIAAHFVSFLADGLLEFVQCELALLDDGRARLICRLPRSCRWREC